MAPYSVTVYNALLRATCLAKRTPAPRHTQHGMFWVLVCNIYFGKPHHFFGPPGESDGRFAKPAILFNDLLCKFLHRHNDKHISATPHSGREPLSTKLSMPMRTAVSREQPGEEGGCWENEVRPRSVLAPPSLLVVVLAEVREDAR